MRNGGGKSPADDTFIPEPALFARQLGWTKGFGPAWSWTRLCRVAEQLYWERRPRPSVTDVAA